MHTYSSPTIKISCRKTTPYEKFTLLFLSKARSILRLLKLAWVLCKLLKIILRPQQFNFLFLIQGEFKNQCGQVV